MLAVVKCGSRNTTSDSSTAVRFLVARPGCDDAPSSIATAAASRAIRVAGNAIFMGPSIPEHALATEAIQALAPAPADVDAAARYPPQSIHKDEQRHVGDGPVVFAGHQGRGPDPPPGALA